MILYIHTCVHVLTFWQVLDVNIYWKWIFCHVLFVLWRKNRILSPTSIFTGAYCYSVAVTVYLGCKHVYFSGYMFSGNHTFENRWDIAYTRVVVKKFQIHFALHPLRITRYIKVLLLDTDPGVSVVVLVRNQSTWGTQSCSN